MEGLQFPHRLTLSERKILTVTAVREVLSFDDTAVVLRTELGILEIRGQKLVLKALESSGGQLSVEGHICGLDYAESRSAGGFWSRLMK